MARRPLLTQADMDALRQIDTCTVSNAIETFGVRLSNAGFADSRIRCIFAEFPPMIGYAVTARLRTVDPPLGGGRYPDRADFWNFVLQLPSPRVVVLEDRDDPPGRGAFIGDVHAAILKALGCVGFVTNGAVRETPAVGKMNLQLFAGGLAVSQAYSHIFEYGAVVNIAGMEVRSGDLLHGDRHGLLSVPQEIAAAIPDVAMKLRKQEEKIIDFCQSNGFSVAMLQEVMKVVG